MELHGLPRRQSALLVCSGGFRSSLVRPIVEALYRIRPDFRLLAPALSTGDAMFKKWCILLPPGTKRSAGAGNYRPLRQAVSWLNGGGLLVVFPAGDLSERSNETVLSMEPRWSDAIARLAILTGSLAIPTLAVGNADGEASIHLGKPICSVTLMSMPSLRAATEHIRVCAARIDPAPLSRVRLVPRWSA